MSSERTLSMLWGVLVKWCGSHICIDQPSTGDVVNIILAALTWEPRSTQQKCCPSMRFQHMTTGPADGWASCCTTTALPATCGSCIFKEAFLDDRKYPNAAPASTWGPNNMQEAVLDEHVRACKHDGHITSPDWVSWISYETTQEEKPSQQMPRSGLCQLRMLSSQLFSKQTQYRQYPIIISFTFLNRLPVGCFHISHPSNGNIPLHLQVVLDGPYTTVSHTHSSWVLVSTSVSGQLCNWAQQGTDLFW